LILAALSVLALGCGGDKDEAQTKPDAAVADAAAGDAESDAEQDAEPTCTKVPEHSDIINAATDAEKVDKQPVLPLLKSDGTLPPLP
jgi:hypothetical protein